MNEYGCVPLKFHLPKELTGQWTTADLIQMQMHISAKNKNYSINGTTAAT